MIYLDYNATAPLNSNVMKKINNLDLNNFGNSSSVHKMGRNSKKIIENVRENILSKLQAKNYELIFTSGATESNNLAIKSFVKNNNIKAVFTSESEHASVLDVIKSLDVEKKYFKLNNNGSISLFEIENILSNLKLKNCQN